MSGAVAKDSDQPLAAVEHFYTKKEQQNQQKISGLRTVRSCGLHKSSPTSSPPIGLEQQPVTFGICL